MIKIYEGDEFFCELEISKICEKYKETDLNIHKNFKLKQFPFLYLSPLLAKKNVFVSDYPEFEKLIVKNPKVIENIPESTILLIYASTIDKRKKAYNIIKKSNIKISFFPELSEKEIVVWAKKKAKLLNVNIDGKALMLLIHYLGASSRSIYNELIRLKDLVEGGKITESVVKLNTPIQREFKLWELSNMLIKGDIRNSYLIVKFLESSSDNFSIIRYLQNFYENLLLVKHSKKLLSSKYQSFAIDKFYENSKKYSYNNLIKILGMCVDAECDVKYGEDSSIVVKSLVNSILMVN